MRVLEFASLRPRHRPSIDTEGGAFARSLLTRSAPFSTNQSGDRNPRLGSDGRRMTVPTGAFRSARNQVATFCVQKAQPTAITCPDTAREPTLGCPSENERLCTVLK
jgi:hypothetical protein